MFNALKELVDLAGAGPLWQAARMRQMQEADGGRPDSDTRMRSMLAAMREAAQKGLGADTRSMSGRTGGQARQLLAAVKAGTTAGGPRLGRAQALALGIAEYNASMGRIVAAPTAGACGILPAALFTLQEEFALQDDDLVHGLYTAAAVGMVIAKRASLSGAQGGCQAECGSAAAMAAAAIVELRGGSARQAADAAGFALMNVLGLVCDPVHGLVEIPCVFRNAAGVANAFVAADLALGGIACPIPPDELIDAMKAVGDLLPASLKETGEGGCAACPSVSDWATAPDGDRP